MSKVPVSAQARIRAASSLQELAIWNHKHREGWRLGQSYYRREVPAPVPPPTHGRPPKPSREAKRFRNSPDQESWELIDKMLKEGMNIDMVAEVMHDSANGRNYWRHQIIKRIERGELVA